MLVFLERFLQLILEFYYSITNSWGVSIIFLSVSVNLLLLPVYMLAEHLQNKERRARNAMQAKLEEIREVFHGSERFVMVRTLYRLHNYHPVMGLRSLASLLVQIPFFFAAYNMLKHYAAFASVPFLFIPDLQTVDALIPIGRFTINLLPIIMTGVNIYAAQIYARRKDPDSLLSTWAMALLFLLLLYTAPAALVVYWTCNNIFSLIKNASLAYKQDKSMPSTVSIISEKISTWLTKDKAVIRTISLCWIVGGYLVISYFLTVVFNRYLSHPLINISGAIFAFTTVILAIKYYRECRGKVLIGLAFGIELVAIVLLLYYIFVPLHEISRATDFVKLFSLLFMGLPNILFIPFFIRVMQRASSPIRAPGKMHNYTVLTGVCICSILLFLLLPIQIGLNFAAEGNISVYDLVLHNIPLMLVSILAALAVYFFTPSFLRLYVGYALVSISLLSLVYALVIPYDIGRMNTFVLILENRLDPALSVYVLEGIGLALLLYGMYTLFKKQTSSLFVIELVFAALLVVQLGQVIAPLRSKERVIAEPNTATDNPLDSPSMAASLLSFSKDKQNIIFLLLDMANGGYIQQILDEDPEFFNGYEGFVWYPNILSISTYTAPSKPPMIGGWNFAPESIGNIRGKNLGEKVIKAYDTFFDTFQYYDYDIALTGLGYYRAQKSVCAELLYDIACLDEQDREFIDYWLVNSQQELIADDADIDFEPIGIVNSVGLMRTVPIAFKRLVYNRGSYLGSSRFKNRLAYEKALRSWSFIDSLSTLSSVTSTKSTVKYFHSDITHASYAIDSECKLRMDVYPDEPIPPDYTGHPAQYGKAAFYTQRCTLASLGKWFQWLKDNNVYDNTKIIIASDHGNSVTDDPMNTQNISPTLMGRSDTVMFNRAHPLLMVKDFNVRGSMETDMRFLSNADAAAILFHSIEGYVPPPDAHPYDQFDPLKRRIAARELYVVDTLFYDWIDMVREEDTFKITYKHVVKDNIFIPENWE